MRNPKRFFVYVMTNGPKAAILYTGITGDLRRRVWQHKTKVSFGFTSRYNLTRLVYYEEFVYPDVAICREKEIKGWRRSKKIALIESMNPRWDDLALRWQDPYKPDAAVTRDDLAYVPSHPPSSRRPALLPAGRGISQRRNRCRSYLQNRLQ